MIQQFFKRKFPYGFLVIIALIIVLLYILFALKLAISLQSPLSTLLLIPYHIIFILLLWSIFESIRTDPGRVPFQWGFGINTQERKYCLICHVFKPERTHHCSTCNRCVLNMDHHCPWIHRCIGFYNRKAFILMLFYTTVITLFNLIIAILSIHTISEDLHSFGGVPMVVITVIGTIINCIIFGAILNFLRFHIGLIMDNYTTLQMLQMRRRCMNSDKSEISPYNMGSYYNWMQVFGRNWLTWGIPIFLPSQGPSGDGILWPKSAPDQENMS